VIERRRLPRSPVQGAAIDAGKAPELATKIFQSIGEIEKLYSKKLLAALK
jgi:hypothetical protein